ATFFYPEVPSDTTGTFYKWGDETFFGAGNTNPAASHGERAVGGDFSRLPPDSLSTDTFRTKEYGFEIALDDTLRKKSQVPTSLETSRVDRVLHETLRARELRVNAVVNATGSISTNNETLSGTSQWSDYANSDPIGKIEGAIEALFLSTGYDPANYKLCAATNDQVDRYLRWHPDLTNKLADSRTKMIDSSAMAEFFNIEEYRVLKTIKNTAKPGQTVVRARLWADDFLLFIKPRNPAPEQVALGYCFTFGAVQTEEWREEPRSTIYLVSHDVDDKLIEESAAYLFKDCLA
ncbi:MAG: hypothetical protein ACE5FA_04730, partial [Dehalococcoidia bacterium]